MGQLGPASITTKLLAYVHLLTTNSDTVLCFPALCNIGIVQTGNSTVLSFLGHATPAPSSTPPVSYGYVVQRTLAVHQMPMNDTCSAVQHEQASCTPYYGDHAAMQMTGHVAVPYCSVLCQLLSGVALMQAAKHCDQNWLL